MKENLKVGDVILGINSLIVPDSRDIDIINAINLIKSQQSRIELLESAIRDLLYKPYTKNSLGANIYVETLRNLMENKS